MKRCLTITIAVLASACYTLASEGFQAVVSTVNENCAEASVSLRPTASDHFFQIHIDGGLNTEGAGTAIWINGKPIYCGRTTADPSLGAGGVLFYYTNEESISIKVRFFANGFPSVETREYKFDKSKGKYLQFSYAPALGPSIYIKQSKEEPGYM
jgi:hypothetical protein